MSKKVSSNLCKVTFINDDPILEGNCNEEAIQWAKQQKQDIPDLVQMSFSLDNFLNFEMKFKPISEDEIEKVIDAIEQQRLKYNTFIDSFQKVKPTPSWSYLELSEKMASAQSFIDRSIKEIIQKIDDPETHSITDVIEFITLAKEDLESVPELIGKTELQATVRYIEPIPGIEELRELMRKSKQKVSK